MQAERWKRIEELFQAALAQPLEKRAEFLSHACPEDLELRSEVESLLKAADDESSFLEGSPVSSIAERPITLKPGDKLGSFEILALLGRGGMGEVYRARDLRLKREVAIKTLPPGFAGDRNRIARFKREAQAASALNHPNIVGVYDIGHDGGMSFIVSELVEGETLARVLQRGPFPLRKLIEVGTQIAEGLAAAHAAGVVHRDLKPGNVMLTRDGRVKVLDFGLAHQDRIPGFDSTTTEVVSQPGLILGTPRYMSPEQARGEPVDARSDLFGLGVVLYELASGKPAFRGGSPVEVMNSILKDDPPELPLSSPPALNRIIRRCIEKEPARRFQSAADLGFALQSLSDPTSRAPSPKRTKRILWWAVAALWVTAAGAAYWAGERSRPVAFAADSTIRRVTYDSGLTTGATISLDGKLIAYASDREVSGGLDIFVQQADGGGTVRITDDRADDYDPVFSADGTEVAFRSERKDAGVYVAPALGGEARLIIPDGRRPRFSPDGRWIMYYVGPENSNNVTPSSDVRLFVQPVSGGTATRIGAGCRVFEKTPVWSPNGTRILFLGSCGSEVTSGWVSDPDGKYLKPNPDLIKAWPTIHGIPAIDQWVASPPRVLLPLHAGDSTFITSVPVSEDGTRVTGAPQRLTFGVGRETHASASIGGRVALSADTQDRHIWAIPIDAMGAPVGSPKQLTNGSAGEGYPALSGDGTKLAFISARANGRRLFFKDLITGREKELSTEGFKDENPVFNSRGTKIVYVHYPASDSWHDALHEVPVSSGITRKIWDKSKFSWPWDLSPDESTLLFVNEDSSRGVASSVEWNSPAWELDLHSQSASIFLGDSEYGVEQTHFSHDGHWVTFSAHKSADSRIEIAPFRRGLVPRSEWIPVTDGPLDAKPHFSNDDRMIFFSSDRDGFRCIWAQRLRSDRHPEGNPFAVFHSHERRRSLGDRALQNFELAIGPKVVVFDLKETRGNIWLLEPAKRDSH